VGLSQAIPRHPGIRSAVDDGDVGGSDCPYLYYRHDWTGAFVVRLY